MSTTKTLAGRIAELCMARELTLSELARTSGVSLPYVSQLASGKRTNPRLPVRRKLANALAVKAAELDMNEDART